MTDRLPIFPLDTVLFPGAFLPLHIFEPRYRLLVRRCVEHDQPFGVVLLKDGPAARAAAEPRTIGTAARIVAVNALPDGRSLIVVRGVSRFAIERPVRDAEPYAVAEVLVLPEPEGADAASVARATAEAFADYLVAAAAVASPGAVEAVESPPEGLGPVELSYHIAARLGLTKEDAQRLLEADTAAVRLASLAHILVREIELMRELLVRMRAHHAGGALN